MLSIFSLLLAFLIPSLEKCLFRPFAHLLIGLFGFLLWSPMSCLYLLDINPLSDIRFANIFFQSVDYLFVSLTRSFQKPFFKMKFNLSIYVLLWIAVLVSSLKTVCLILNAKDFLQFFPRAVFYV